MTFGEKKGDQVLLRLRITRITCHNYLIFFSFFFLYLTNRLGTRIIYERNFLMNLKNSPLARSPPNMAFIPGVTNIEPNEQNPKYDILDPTKNKTINLQQKIVKNNNVNRKHHHHHHNHHDEQPQFDIDI